MSDWDVYQSPFSWRYGSPEMRRIWSEAEKRRLWRRIWLALAETQAQFGLVSEDQLSDLRRNVDNIDLKRALEIEAEIHHDLMAELKTFAEQSPLGGAVLHLGATSMDIEDNAEALRLRAALDLILQHLRELLQSFTERIEQTADLPLIGFTHLQPAEPSTLGYRLAFYAQDLFSQWQSLRELREELRGKGFKGAVGTAAAYADLIGLEDLPRFEETLSRKLNLPFYPVTSQVAPRIQEYRLVSQLAGLGAVLNKFAFDLRFLQSPPVGEWQEPFGRQQVGSSAMPFKRNPIMAEKINSLARALANLPQVAWDNAAYSLLERTLDDSANRRSLLPESFLITEEILITSKRIVKGLQINEAAIRRNVQRYAPFAVTERVLMALVKQGADRQVMHERLRTHSLTAWQAVQNGEENPLVDLLCGDEQIGGVLGTDHIEQLMRLDAYLGIAPQRARQMAAYIRTAIQDKAEEHGV
ncbi:MAG: adenylosuccinate lyase [Bellilinea sp.]|nr:adenylosuccinate lyase [Bellilinea sp.]